jgi:pSer/pThr/pTyr-binding forkhead associated (FHA) protein
MIGRSEECMMTLRGRLEDLLVSRRHCLLHVYEDRVEIRDLESRNGTYVNGVRIGFGEVGNGSSVFRRRLHDGDRLRLGISTIQVKIAAGVEAPSDATAVVEA